MRIDSSDICKLLASTGKNAIEFTKSETTEQLPLASSKIGGKPHLPKGFKWPYYKGTTYDDIHANRPLAFIAQINLAGISRLDSDNLLPHSGFLYFFYELETMCWGYDPKDIGCARTFYFDVQPDQLEVEEFPDDLSENFRIPEFSLEFRKNINFPDFEEFSELCDGDFDWNEFEKAEKESDISHDVSPEGNFKLLGYADSIQGAMLSECESVTSGIYCGRPQNLSETQRRKIAEGSREWMLLAQFGTISDEIMFGDCGCIYFYIRRSDLSRRRFDKIHLILQCG